MTSPVEGAKPKLVGSWENLEGENKSRRIVQLIMPDGTVSSLVIQIKGSKSEIQQKIDDLFMTNEKGFKTFCDNNAKRIDVFPLKEYGIRIRKGKESPLGTNTSVKIKLKDEAEKERDATFYLKAENPQELKKMIIWFNAQKGKTYKEVSEAAAKEFGEENVGLVPPKPEDHEGARRRLTLVEEKEKMAAKKEKEKKVKAKPSPEQPPKTFEEATDIRRTSQAMDLYAGKQKIHEGKKKEDDSK